MPSSFNLGHSAKAESDQNRVGFDAPEIFIYSHSIVAGGLLVIS